jgi:Rrf2 family protein
VLTSIRGGENTRTRAVRYSMLRLSKKADYALIAMKHLAVRDGHGSSSAREIAEQYEIPVELLAKVLQRLVRKGLLASQQGTRGGYQLARSAEGISVADVIQAIDGPLTVTACSMHDDRCGQFSKCNVRDPLWRIKERILAALATCTIAEMVAESGPDGAPVEHLPLVTAH